MSRASLRTLVWRVCRNAVGNLQLADIVRKAILKGEQKRYLKSQHQYICASQLLLCISQNWHKQGPDLRYLRWAHLEGGDILDSGKQVSRGILSSLDYRKPVNSTHFTCFTAFSWFSLFSSERKCSAILVSIWPPRPNLTQFLLCSILATYQVSCLLGDLYGLALNFDGLRLWRKLQLVDLLPQVKINHFYVRVICFTVFLQILGQLIIWGFLGLNIQRSSLMKSLAFTKPRECHFYSSCLGWGWVNSDSQASRTSSFSFLSKY